MTDSIRLALPGALALSLLAGLASAPAFAQRPDSEPLSLAEVYSLAAARNPMLRASRSAAEAVATRESAARLPPDPQFQVGLMNASLPGLRTDMPGAMAPSLQVMQMVPFPGKLSLSGRLARQSTALAREVADETGWEVRARAAGAFYAIYQTDRQVEVAGETLSLLKNFEQVAKAMYAAGEGRQSDVLRASVEVARMEAELARMRAMRDAAASRLNAVLDLPLGSPVGAVAYPPLPLELPTPAELSTLAADRRPLLAGREIDVDRAATQRALVRRELWPDLSIGVQYGQRPGAAGTERMGSLMVGFTLPVFASQRQLRMRGEAEAMLEMAVAELADARAGVDADIAALSAELDRARTLVRLYRSEVLPQANANVASSFSAYRVGTVDFMTLVDAQMTMNQYQQELFALFAEYGRMIAELEGAVGRELPISQNILSEDL